MACSDKSDTQDKPKYFAIKKYFQEEANRLSTTNPTVSKTVAQNNISQQKNIKIDDWLSELELFLASDINKPAWRDSYKTISSLSKVEYIAKDKNLRTRKIIILYDLKGKPKQISIYNNTKNTLYNSEEKLYYYPDSAYTVQQQQNVLVMGKNSYIISGKIQN